MDCNSTKIIFCATATIGVRVAPAGSWPTKCRRLLGSGWDAEVCMGFAWWPPLNYSPYWGALALVRDAPFCTKCKGGFHD